MLQEKLIGWNVTITEMFEINIETVQIIVESGPSDAQKNVSISWTNQDEDLGTYILGLLQNMR